MTEDRAATALARWLTAGSGEPPPEDVDPDAVAAVYALRPDRAPAARVDMDAILRDLEDGPLATPPTPEEEVAAARFRDWLDEPDAELDDAPDAQEAVYALRPDLAPAARLDLDGLLDDMAFGASAAEIDTLPSSIPAPTELSTLEAANTVPGAGRRRAWMWVLPGAGALLMAALALIVVLPMAKDAPRGFPEPVAATAPNADRPPLLSSPIAESQEQSRRAPMDAPPPPPTPDPALRDQTPMEVASATARAEAEGQGDAAAGGGFGILGVPNDNLDKDRARETEKAEAKAAEPLATASPPADLRAAPTAPTSTPRLSANAGPVNAIPELDNEESLSLSDGADRQKDDAVAQETPAPMAAAGTSGMSVGSVYDEAKEVSKPKTSSTKAPATRTLATAAPAVAQAPDTWTGDLSAAEAALAAGQRATAIQLLTNLLSAADPAVVMKAALDLAPLQLADGQKASALRTVRKGLAVGPEPADLRAQLLALLSQITAAPNP